MKRFGLTLILTALFSFTISANIHAAKRIVYENFDDKDLDSPIYKGQGSINSYVTGRGGSGYAAQFAQTSYGEPDNTLCYQPGSWPTNEIYVSNWMRYPSYTGRGKKKTDGSYASQWNNKIFYMHISTKGDYVAAVMDGDDWLHTSVRPGGGGGYYNYGVPNVVDGNWHHYEWYINIATGKVKVWVDGKLELDRNHSSIDWPTGKIHRVCSPSVDTGGSTFVRQIDDYEVWDGMPSSSTSTTTSNSNNAPPPPGKPYVLD